MINTKSKKLGDQSWSLRVTTRKSITKFSWNSLLKMYLQGETLKERGGLIKDSHKRNIRLAMLTSFITIRGVIEWRIVTFPCFLIMGWEKQEFYCNLKKFVKTPYTNLVPKSRFHGKAKASSSHRHNVEIAKILSHTFFWKKIVKAMVLLKKLLNSWFDEKNYVREFLVFPHCDLEKREF